MVEEFSAKVGANVGSSSTARIKNTAVIGLVKVEYEFSQVVEDERSVKKIPLGEQHKESNHARCDLFSSLSEGAVALYV
jgi:hypothetical protein